MRWAAFFGGSVALLMAAILYVGDARSVGELHDGLVYRARLLYERGAEDMKAKILTELRGPGSSAHDCPTIVEGVEIPEYPWRLEP